MKAKLEKSAEVLPDVQQGGSSRSGGGSPGDGDAHPGAAAAEKARAFTIKRSNGQLSSFPPWEAPPPSAIARRIVICEGSGLVSDDEDTSG